METGILGLQTLTIRKRNTRMRMRRMIFISKQNNMRNF